MKQDALIKDSYSMDNFFSSEVVVNEPNYSDLTVILPFRYSENNFGNMENFNVILNYLKFIGVKHIIISEEDEYSKINDFLSALDINFEDLQILFTKSETFFNKSIAINNAVKICNTPYVAIMDYGILVPKKSFDNALSLVDSFYDFVYASNDYFKEIDNLVNLLNDFDFKKINTIEEYALKYSNILFCKKEHLMNIGGYNPIFINDYYLDMELLLRIILSEFNLFYINDYSYHLNYSTFLSDEDINTFCNQYNFAKFNDINLLINRNEEMYLNSCVFKKNEVNSSSSKYLISVIIPIYNCKYFYIDRCITSLKNQTLGFENIEVILVVDSNILYSSKHLIESYVKNYENVKSIFLDQSFSEGIAKNEGIKVATSDYVTFLNHEDYFVRDICEICYENIKKNEADIIVTNFIHLENSFFTYENSFEKSKKFLNNSSEFMDIFLIPHFTGTKTYKKEFLLKNNLFFKNYKEGDDLLFNYETLFNANGIILIDAPSIVFSNLNNYKYSSSSSFDYSKKSLISLIQSFTEDYNLFNIFAPDFTHIPLNNINFFYHERLFKSDLELDEFVEICEEIKAIGTFYLSNEKVEKNQNCLNLTDLIMKNEFSKAFNEYQKLI